MDGKSERSNDLAVKVLNLKDHGCSNFEIAVALGIRENRVKSILKAVKEN